MGVRSGQTITADFTTANPTTGAAANADSLPTGTLVVNGTDNGATVTVTNKATGDYKFAVTLPTLASGDVVQMRIAATVSSVAGKAIVWKDACDVSLDSSGRVNVGKWLDVTVPTPNVPGVPIIDFEYFLGTLCSGGMLGNLGPAGASGGLALATENTVASGNATAGSNNTITLQSTSSVYPGARLHLISATGTGQSRIITAVNGLVVTVGRNWDVNPASGTAYRVVQDDAPSGGGGVTLTDLNTGLGTLQTHGDNNWEGADPATVAAAVAAAVLVDASKKIHTTDTGVIVDGGTVDTVTDPVTVDTGDGTIPIDENTIALDGTNLLVTEFGEPVPGVRISVWLKSEYAANPVSPNIAPKGRTVSNDDGTWRSKIFLDPGSYIVTARVPNSGTEIPKEIEVGV